MTRTDVGVPPGHRPFQPRAGAPVRWPDAFGRRFLVTVDVEEEFDWARPFDPAQRSTTAMRAFPDAHARFAQWGVGLTCMIDHPIATDPAAVAILKGVLGDGRSAIGAQLHPWVTPPFEGPITAFTSFGGNLPPDLEQRKIAVLTDTIGAAFGARPSAFRAGRYGLGPNTLRSLAAAGYRLDSSVRPGYDDRAQGGPDHSAAGSAAYRMDGVLELPLTTVFTGAAGRRGPALYRSLGHVPRARGLAARTGLVSRIALTPEGMPVADVLRALDVVARTKRLLVLSFHSPSLVPGHTPYVRDAADLTRFWDWWEAVLARLDRLGFRSASLDEVLAAADAA